MMQTKFNIGDFVWVLFKVKEINVTNKDIIKYSLDEVNDGLRKGMYLANKREEELVPANFEEEYDIDSATYRTKIYRVVDAEEKKGTWTEVPLDSYVSLHRCSNCLKKFPNKSNYCPNCGAKMEVEDGNDQNMR